VRKFLLTVFVCGLVAAFAPTLQADTFGQAFQTAHTGTQLGNGPFTLGWSFDVTSSITVTDLAVFTDTGNLVEDHEVGIWDAAGNLLVSAFVGPTCGANGAVLDQLGQQLWCHTLVSPTALAPGTYTIGATWNSLTDDMIFDGTINDNVNGPNVAFLENAYIAGGFADPTNTTGDGHSYFGPNFSYGSTSTPEPGTLVLLGSGLLGAVGVVRRKLNL